jgi:hypothetical protein
MQTAKQVALDVINSLPDNCSLDDISYRLYLQRKLKGSAEDIEAGRVHSTDEVEEQVRSWFTSSGPTAQ